MPKTQTTGIFQENNTVNTRLVGILGGTFDPLHYGHTTPALDAKNQLGLDQLLLLPAHIPPHKSRTFAEPKHRRAMIAAFCDANPSFTLDDRELRKNSASYTVETLEELKLEQPETQFFFFIGMDSLMSFTQWHRFQDILKLCHVVVNTRANYPLTNLNSTTRELLKLHQVNNLGQAISHKVGKILLIDSHLIDISSTDIRRKIQHNNHWQTLVSQEVAQYIETHQLYT